MREGLWFHRSFSSSCFRFPVLCFGSPTIIKHVDNVDPKHVHWMKWMFQKCFKMFQKSKKSKKSKKLQWIFWNWNVCLQICLQICPNHPRSAFSTCCKRRSATCMVACSSRSLRNSLPRKSNQTKHRAATSQHRQMSDHRRIQIKAVRSFRSKSSVLSQSDRLLALSLNDLATGGVMPRDAWLPGLSWTAGSYAVHPQLSESMQIWYRCSKSPKEIRRLKIFKNRKEFESRETSGKSRLRAWKVSCRPNKRQGKRHRKIFPASDRSSTICLMLGNASPAVEWE